MIGLSAVEGSIGPVTQSERVVALDALRGFALLGILIMNIQSFSTIFAAYFNPLAYGNFQGANYWVWYVEHVLADQKFMTIFSMLFGAGIVLMTSRREGAGLPSAAVHYRRMAVLLLFGLLHAYLLWYGDILYLYAMCGIVVFLLRKQPARRLLVVGLLLLAVGSGISLASGLSMPGWSEESMRQFMNDWMPPPEKIAEEISNYRGTWLGQMRHRVPTSFEFQTFVFGVWGFWRAAGLMLLGMALFKRGVFSARQSVGFYFTLIAVAVLIGIPTIIYGAHRNLIVKWDLMYSFFFGGLYNYWASILVSLGWVGAVMLVCQRSVLRSLTRALAAVGQMAFTNYLMQTIICTTIFYGHGFGVFGKVERVGQIPIVLAIWAIQLILSPIWLRHFQFGPFEWLWRSLTYMKWEPFGRSPTTVTH